MTVQRIDSETWLVSGVATYYVVRVRPRDWRVRDQFTQELHGSGEWSWATAMRVARGWAAAATGDPAPSYTDWSHWD